MERIERNKAAMVQVLLFLLGMNVVAGYSSTRGTGVHSLAQKINNFSRRVMSELSKSDDDVNIVLSPLSIGNILGMLILGADSDTRTELEQASRFGADVAQLFKSLNHRVAFLSPIAIFKKRNPDITFANGLFYDRRQRLKIEFLKKAHECFQAMARALDFALNQEEARKTINSWVSNKTRGMINNILPAREPIDFHTSVVIANAVYFSGAWEYPFHPKETEFQPFTTASGREILVSMMRQESKLAYKKMCVMTKTMKSCLKEPQPDIVVLPYANKKFVMVIVVPNEDYPLAKIEENMHLNYTTWRRGVMTEIVDLSMPKFEVNFESDLKATLQKLRIYKAFKASANFDNLSSHKISFAKLVHKASVVVDERGTTAAAATGAIGYLKIAAPAAATFEVNRSFIFVIEDKSTGVQLFTGKIANPGRSTTVLSSFQG